MKNKAGVAVRIVVNGRRLVYLSVFLNAAPRGSADADPTTP